MNSQKVTEIESRIKHLHGRLNSVETRLRSKYTPELSKELKVILSNIESLDAEVAELIKG